MTDPQSPPSGDPVPARLSAPTCPTCGKAATARYRPFCSKRCADVDLSRWLGGGYVVPGREPAAPEDLAAAIQDQNDGSSKAD